MNIQEQINQISINHPPLTINQLLQGMEEAIEWYIKNNEKVEK